MPKAWLGRFGRSVAEQVLEGVRERREAIRNPGERTTVIGGQEVPLSGTLDAADGGEYWEEGASGPRGAGQAMGGAGWNALNDGGFETFGSCGGAGGAFGLDGGGPMGAGGGSGFGGAHVGGFGGMQVSGYGGAGGTGFGGGSGRMQDSGYGGIQGSGPGGMQSAAYGGLDGRGAGAGCSGPDSLTAREVLMGLSFAFTGKEDEAGGTLSAWGRMSESNFSGAEDTLSVQGRLSTALAGVDYARPGWLAGVALSHTDAKGGYAHESAGAGELGSSLTAATAYGTLSDLWGLEVWGALGHGRGGLTLDVPTGPGAEAGLNWTMAAAGARGGLLAPAARWRGVAGLGHRRAVGAHSLRRGGIRELGRGACGRHTDAGRL